MSAWSIGRAAGLVALAALAGGCMMDSGSSGGGAGYAGGGAGGTSSAPPATQPMLVEVDPNQTMSATPGDGVGVFVQYQTGGHWDVWWTCDTNKTSLDCQFDNTVSVAKGAIANLAGQGSTQVQGGATAPGTQVEVQTDTTTGVDGVTFDTPFAPGQTPVITLDAKMNGVADGSYLFFVQDGKVNGGYQGTVTDPLMLEPTAP